MGKAYLDTWIQINKPWITNLRGDWPWRFYVVILSLRLFDSLSTVNKSTNQLRLSIGFIGILVTNLVSSVENPLRLLVKQPVVNSIQLANSRPTTKSTNNKPPSQVLYKTTCVHQKKTHTHKKKNCFLPLFRGVVLPSHKTPMGCFPIGTAPHVAWQDEHLRWKACWHWPRHRDPRGASLFNGKNSWDKGMAPMNWRK